MKYYQYLKMDMETSLSHVMNLKVTRTNSAPVDYDSNYKRDSSLESSSRVEDEIHLRKRQTVPGSVRPRTIVSTMSKKSTCEYDEPPIKMTDYLEKRSKMLGWKRYWFVLDGHLLTYYKSKDDYERIAPFSGSINLGIASIVRPIQINGCKGFPLQIVTRSQAYYLRSLDKLTLDKWLLALQETTSTPPKISSPYWTDPGIQFYRYSFAALSQWSLQDSSDDITGSLSNLPKNFYLPSGSLKKKCLSFTSLQNPSASGFTESPNLNSKSNHYGINPGHKEMTELNKRTRNATSMLVLESSPQATELKEELAKKLSFAVKPEKRISSSSSRNSKKISDEQNQHHYDEIIDFETMYQNENQTGENTNATDDSSSGIYESVDPWEKLKVDHSPSPTAIEKTKDTIQKNFRGKLAPIQEVNFNEAQSSKIVKKKKGIAGIFQKIFKRDDHNQKRVASSAGKNMNITGPIDLSHLKISKNVSPIQCQLKSTIAEKSKDSPIKPSNSEKSKNSPPRSQIKSTSPEKSKNSPLSGSQNIFTNDSVMDELKSKVGQLKRANSELKPSAIGITKCCLDENDQKLKRRSTIQSTVPIPDTKPKITPMTLLFQNSITEYQQKLAKFNRLSAHLNPSFVAIFKPPNQGNIVLGQMGRSSSCKIKPEDPPLLPPKKKNVIGTINPYDYPSNNSPVTTTPNEPQSGNNLVMENVIVNKKLPTIRELAKKNSAPDIMFPSSSLSSSREILPHILNQRFEIDEITTTLPPRPPKINKKSWTFANYSEDFANISDVEQAKENLRGISKKLQLDVAQKSKTCKSCYAESHDDGAHSSESRELLLSETETKTEVMEPSNKSLYVDVILAEEKSDFSILQVNTIQTVENLNDSISESAKTTLENEIYSNDLVLSTESEVLNSKFIDKVEKDQKYPEKEEDEVSKGHENSEPVAAGNLSFESKTKDPLKGETQIEPENSPKNIQPELPEVDFEVIYENCDIPLKLNDSLSLPTPKDQPKSTAIDSPKIQTNNSIVNQSFSPTLSCKSIDIDNLDALSELSDDHDGNSTTIIEIPSSQINLLSNNILTKPKLVDTHSANEEKNYELRIYENLKYATINMLVTEFEVVEETDDETSELYDNFPSEFVTPIAPLPKPTTILMENQNNTVYPSTDIDKINSSSSMKSRVQSIRHSGIDELQKYLQVESLTTDSESTTSTSTGTVKIPSGGALSRLGHSPAVDTLQRLLQNN